MILRPYQKAAVEAIQREWEEAHATLVVMPTGTGKTQVFSQVARDRLALGKILVVAHREELIFQAADRLHQITGERPGIEMASMDATSGLFEGGRIVVSTVQTQTAGKDGGRMAKFDPLEFSTLVIDEAHHAPAKSYKKVVDWYTTNPKLKVLGVTATPDRHDEEALGQIFETVAYDYELPDAIRDGWLVPIFRWPVEVHGLDFSKIRTTAGDLNGADLALVMEAEEMLHKIAGPTLEIAKGRKTLVFAASLAHAERLCEILNRPGYGGSSTAEWVHGGTPKDDRRDMMRRYSRGEFQVLVNVGVATEGFDEPGIQCVVMGRPTKSRALYAQMAGRGTRALPGIVDVGPSESTLFEDAAALRRDRIAHSAKPACEIIDFVGNSGRHELISAESLLGGKYSDEAVELAGEMALAADGEPMDVAKALDDAEKEVRRRAIEKKKAEEEEARKAQEARRVGIAGRARFTAKRIDAFEVLDIEPVRERGWDRGKILTSRQRGWLESQGIDVDELGYGQAKQILNEMDKRGSIRQIRALKRAGWYDPSDTKDEVKRKMNALAANNWRKPAKEPTPPPAEVSDAGYPF